MTLQDNIEEIQNHLASDILTENAEVGRSYIAPNRLRPDHYKGMPIEQQQAIILEQAVQREVKLTMAAAEKDINTSYDVYAESVRKMGQYTDAEVRVMEENLQLAASQSASKSFLTTQVYKNSVDPSFFDQFGKTSR